MTTQYSLLAALIIKERLRAELPDYAQDPFQDALAGRSVWKCVSAAPNRYRGALAYLFFLRCRAGECSAEDYRGVLSAAWGHDHGEVVAAARSRRSLKAMFQTAAFPPPAGIPDTVQIWRGVGRNTAMDRRGVSWTTRRSVACWFAMRETALLGLQHKGAQPAVLTVTVPRSALLHWSDDRGEAEVVCFDTSAATVDGTRDDWRAEYEAYSAEIARKQRAWLEAKRAAHAGREARA
jgi:hypothetical protein